MINFSRSRALFHKKSHQKKKKRLMARRYHKNKTTSGDVHIYMSSKAEEKRDFRSEYNNVRGLLRMLLDTKKLLWCIWIQKIEFKDRRILNLSK